MTLTQDDRRGCPSQALVRWADQLAVGAPWEEVEAEIISRCDGRVDLLAQLLLHAETHAVRLHAAAGPAAGWVTEDERQGRASSVRLLRRVAPGRSGDAVVWHLPRRTSW